MRLVHKQPVTPQLLKGHHIIFLALIVQFFQSGFQRFPGFLQLLDGKVGRIIVLCVLNGINNLVDLIRNLRPLPLQRQGDFFKLGMSDDDRIILPGGNPGAKRLAVGRLEITLGCRQNIGSGIEL